ncbi:hypothetical protein [Brevundimonas lutea]|uniref:hypothetical protein n=1 Tax=Brevundimonas lutea TaxID=2293980 RepID=UPI000F038054|nr:hypothetical protein [Brevundimonas lutea]
MAVTFGARHADLTAAADLRLGAARSERSRQVVRVDASCPDDSNDLIVGLVISEASGDAATWENVRLVLSHDLDLADSSTRAIPSEDLPAFLE